MNSEEKMTCRVCGKAMTKPTVYEDPYTRTIRETDELCDICEQTHEVCHGCHHMHDKYQGGLLNLNSEWDEKCMWCREEEECRGCGDLVKVEEITYGETDDIEWGAWCPKCAAKYDVESED